MKGGVAMNYQRQQDGTGIGCIILLVLLYIIFNPIPGPIDDAAVTAIGGYHVLRPPYARMPALNLKINRIHHERSTNMSTNGNEKFFAELPEHLAKMALFKVNTGCREAEVCNLKWEWEEKIPQLDTSVFIIPAYRVKNREERLVVLNSVARAVVDEMRGKHEEYVFIYRGRPIQHMNDSAWKKARVRAGLPQVRVHDLKHTFGRRLRAAGVSFEDRQDLLGHKSSRVTTHYSAPELINLIQAAERVCGNHWHKSGTMVILKGNSRRLTAVK